MIRAWRIATDTPDYAADDLSGAGAGISGGRWNRKGTPMLYAFSSIALACLETVVHLAVSSLPLNRYLVSIEIPDPLWDQAVWFDPPNHVGWDAQPAGRVSLDFGDDWVASSESVILIVPSVIIPDEINILINPQHPDAARLAATRIKKFIYDHRIKS